MDLLNCKCFSFLLIERKKFAAVKEGEKKKVFLCKRRAAIVIIKGEFFFFPGKRRVAIFYSKPNNSTRITFDLTKKIIITRLTKESYLSL